MDIKTSAETFSGPSKSRTGLPEPFRKIALVCAVIVAATGVIALTGWLLGRPLFTSIRADYIPMAPNTAVSFLLLGMGLLGATLASQPGRRFAWSASIFVLLLSALRLGEYATGADWGVDGWLLRAPGRMLGLAPTGKMSLPTAVNLLFAGAALLLLPLPVPRRLTSALAGGLSVVVTFVGLVFSLGYFYGVPLLYGTQAIPMAPNTATGFVVLGAGLLAVVAGRNAAERKLAKAHLQASEERYRTTLRSVGDGVIVVDTETRVTIMNPVAEALTGWKESEARGRALEDIFRIVNEDTRAAVENPVLRVLREGLVVGLANHTLLIARDGIERPIADSGAPVRDDTGAITGVVLIFRDQTGERSAQEGLRASEAKYRVLVEATGTGYLILDPQGRVLDANEEYVRLTGRGSLKDILGRPVTDWTAAADGERNALAVAQCARDGFIRNFTVNYAAPGGALTPVEINASVAGAGESARIISLVRDVTERKLQESRQELAVEVLKCLADADSRNDVIRNILLSVRRSTGIEAAGLRLRAGEDYPYYHQNGFPEEFILKENSLCARQPGGEPARDASGKVILECMCGNIICGRTDPALPFFTKGGSFWTNGTTELLASTTSEERQAHTRNNCNKAGYESVALIPLRSKNAVIGLLQLNDRRKDQFTPEMIEFFEGLGASIGIALERKTAAAEKTRLEEQFRQAQKMESVGRLAGGIAHDFNNLLTAILSYAGFLRDGLAEDDPKRKDVQEILAAGARASELTRQLLAFSRRQILNPRVLDLNATAVRDS